MIQKIYIPIQKKKEMHEMRMQKMWVDMLDMDGKEVPMINEEESNLLLVFGGDS